MLRNWVRVHLVLNRFGHRLHLWLGFELRRICSSFFDATSTLTDLLIGVRYGSAATDSSVELWRVVRLRLWNLDSDQLFIACSSCARPRRLILIIWQFQIILNLGTVIDASI